MSILVTGGAGFIGTNLVRMLVSQERSIVTFDKLTYAGNLANLKDLPRDLHTFVRGDLADPKDVNALFETYQPEAVIHLAAESHVDRSIDDPTEFVRTNVLGTLVLLQAAKQHQVKKFVQVSTDEVYGSLGPEGYFTETTPIAPNSPYSASKASADLLVRSFYKTFGFPACITRCSNNYGPYQFPEKLIPLFATNAMEDKAVPLYGKGENIRDWIHVDDHCRALATVLDFGKIGQVYNIGGNSERANIDIARTILRHLEKSEDLIQFVQDRPGHDFRYAIDSGKIKKELGWEPSMQFEQGIFSTIEWYKTNRQWWEEIKSGTYREYYEKMYADRLSG